MFRGRRIAVTGSAGFVGSRLVAHLKENHANVIEIDRVTSFDLAEFDRVKQIPEFDTMIHLAAKSFVPDSFAHPRDFYETNVLTTINALELCRLYKAKMVFASSYVYGIPKYLPINEEHPIAAFNPYAQTKIIGEQLCQGYCRDFGLKVIVLRPFNIYGKNQNSNFLIPTIINQAKTGKIVLKDPHPKRDLVFIEDVVNAYMKCIQYDPQDVEIFNIGCGKSYSVREIAEMIAKHFGNPEIEFTFEKRQHDIADTVADISKARRILGWQPQVSFEESLQYF